MLSSVQGATKKSRSDVIALVIELDPQRAVGTDEPFPGGPTIGCSGLPAAVPVFRSAPRARAGRCRRLKIWASVADSADSGNRRHALLPTGEVTGGRWCPPIGRAPRIRVRRLRHPGVTRQRYDDENENKQSDWRTHRFLPFLESELYDRTRTNSPVLPLASRRCYRKRRRTSAPSQLLSQAMMPSTKSPPASNIASPASAAGWFVTHGGHHPFGSSPLARNTDAAEGAVRNFISKFAASDCCALAPTAAANEVVS